MWYNHKFFKYGSAVLLILLIIFMLGQIDFFLSPFKTLISTIFIPVLTAGLSYYILRPLVRLIEERLHLSRFTSIISAFAIVTGLFAVISTYTGSVIADQFTQLTNDLPRNFESAKKATSSLIHNNWLGFIPLDQLEQKAAEYLGKATSSLSAIIFGFISTLTNIGTILAVFPFILFYFLKDDHRFVHNILKFVPKKHSRNVEEILKDIDAALSSYILGQMTVAVAIGALMFIGYLIIGLKYSLLFALFAMVTCIIPFFGPWIGIIPAVLVGLTVSAFMALKVVLVMLIVQQIDGNFISPQVMRKSLDIHPVTVILLLMIGVSLYGFIGLIVVIPAYAALKVTVRNIYEMYFAGRLDI